MKKKWIKGIVITSIVGVILLGVGTGLAFYIGGDYVYKELFQNFLADEVKGALGEEDGDLIEVTDVAVLESLGLLDKVVSREEEGGDESEGAEMGNSALPTPTTEANHKPVKETSAQGEEKTSTTVKVSKDDLQQAIMDKVDSIAGSVPVSDKVAMMRLVVKRVSKDNINYLASLAADGLSSADLAIAKGIARASFPPDELELVYMYYKKYAYLIK